MTSSPNTDISDLPCVALHFKKNNQQKEDTGQQNHLIIYNPNSSKYREIFFLT